MERPPLATPAHRLSIFSVDPRSCVANLEEAPEVDFEDDWFFLNSMLKTAFGWGESEMRENMKEMMNRGEHGLDGFIRFFKYFVLQRGLEGVMIEAKIDGRIPDIKPDIFTHWQPYPNPSLPVKSPKMPLRTRPCSSLGLPP